MYKKIIVNEKEYCETIETEETKITETKEYLEKMKIRYLGFLKVIDDKLKVFD